MPHHLFSEDITKQWEENTHARNLMNAAETAHQLSSELDNLRTRGEFSGSLGFDCRVSLDFTIELLSKYRRYVENILSDPDASLEESGWYDLQFGMTFEEWKKKFA